MKLDFLHLASISGSALISWVEIFLVIAVVAWIGVAQGSKIARFVGETKSELKKCSWPWNPKEKFPRSHNELLQSTLIVSISALFLAAFVTVWDFLLVHVLGIFTRH